VTTSAAPRSLPPESQTDAEIIARVLGGDVDAYATLVGRYRARLGRYALHMLGSREDAEEVLQDAFVRAYRSLARCEDPEKFGAWLFRILVNRCHTSGARGQRQRQTFVSDDVALLGASEDHPAERDAWREELNLAVQQLGPDQREAFLMKYVEDLSYEEMSQVTGVGISALKMRVLRACDRLREVLAGVNSGS
jgi:RNA polymerase sigma-70 factor (ECF subfamily)